MVVKRLCRAGLLILLAASGLLTGSCAILESDSPIYIALLAPFEGRYQEVGYQALYATRLVVGDDPQFTLLAIDDGGSIETAIERAQGIVGDPKIRAVVVLGYAATARQTLSVFDELPVFVAGDWGVADIALRDNIFVMSHPGLSENLTVSPRISLAEAIQATTPLIGGTIFALEQFTDLQDSLTDIIIASSAELPDTAFIERYLSSAEFAPQPGLIAHSTYITFDFLAGWMSNNLTFVKSPETTRNALVRQIQALDAFTNHYWADAELYFYRYNSTGELTYTDNVVE